MHNNNTFCPELQINRQAWAILALLNTLCLDDDDEATSDTDFRAWAWYNGRERGIAITVSRPSNPSRVFTATFGESRSSDSIFVDCWTTSEPYFNGPTVKDLPDFAYQERKRFPWGDAGKAAEYIANQVRDHLLAVAKDSPEGTFEERRLQALSADA